MEQRSASLSTSGCGTFLFTLAQAPAAHLRAWARDTREKTQPGRIVCQQESHASSRVACQQESHASRNRMPAGIACQQEWLSSRKTERARTPAPNAAVL
eukprot:2575895-Prymnesium_polylepis.1